MTVERLLLTLSVIAAGLLMTAIAFTGGKGPPITGLAGGLPVPSVGSLPEWPSPAGLGRAGDSAVFVTGLVAGWLLRWIYLLPWAAMPRALVVWLLGWRSSVLMLALAVGCVAVLLLY